ncbi:MAG: M20 family metallopeptidase [Bacillota bacterium]
MPTGETALAGFIDDRRDDLMRFTQDLVRARSVNPPGSESGVARVVAGCLEGFGIPYQILDHGDGRASIVGVVRGNGGSGHLMFNGHADTVPVGEARWGHDPFSGEMDGGRLYGRGASDMKSGVASMVFAAGALARCGVPLGGDVIVAVTAGEEVDSIGAWAVSRSEWSRGVDKVLIGEPSDLDIYVAEKGALWLNLEARGKTAHGAMPELGVNAVEHLIRLLSDVKRELSDEFAPAKHSLLGRATVSVNTIAGGIKTNVIPDFAQATVDIRTLPGHVNEDILERVRGMARRAQERAKGLTVNCSAVNDRAAYEIPAGHGMVQELVSVLQELRGNPPAISGVGYYTDASVFWPALRVPIVICGPGCAGLAHQPDEYAETSKIVEAAKAYAIWAGRVQDQARRRP